MHSSNLNLLSHVCIAKRLEDFHDAYTSSTPLTSSPNFESYHTHTHHTYGTCAHINTSKLAKRDFESNADICISLNDARATKHRATTTPKHTTIAYQFARRIRIERGRVPGVPSPNPASSIRASPPCSIVRSFAKQRRRKTTTAAPKPNV